MLTYETTGTIFDIQRFCTHDGPGIRTTVFVKGCPLRCAWCHNPESQRRFPELFYSPHLCLECDSCQAVCPTGEGRLRLVAGDRNGCEDCLRCAAVCPGGAIEVAGREMSVGEVLAEAEKDRVFYEESGGGITLSGGEPLTQFSFTHALLRAAKAAGLHTCVETCGFAPVDHFEDIAPFVDLFLWDIKDTDPDRHKAWTGVAPDRIVTNLRRVDALGREIRVRCMLIGGLNDDPRHARSVARLAASLRHCSGVEVLPYHGLGGSKHQRLGRSVPDHPFTPPGGLRLSEFKSWLRREGLNAA